MKIGLVLSGGMAKGAYQIGALKAIEKYIPREDIKCISCASIGVLNGYAYATNALDKAQEMWETVCDGSHHEFISRILRSSLLQHNIKSLYDPEKVLDTPFYAALLDISSRKLVYKNLTKIEKEKTPRYLKASVAMPIYNRAVIADDVAYFDGAMVDNIPVFPLLKFDLDYLICVYFDDVCYRFENASFDRRIIKITFPTESVLMQSLVLSRDSIDDMITEGYEKTEMILKTVFANGFEDTDYIYKTIERLNKDHRQKSLRITGDLLVTNLNKITQRLTKRKIL